MYLRPVSYFSNPTDPTFQVRFFKTHEFVSQFSRQLIQKSLFEYSIVPVLRKLTHKLLKNLTSGISKIWKIGRIIPAINMRLIRSIVIGHDLMINRFCWYKDFKIVLTPFDLIIIHVISTTVAIKFRSIRIYNVFLVLNQVFTVTQKHEVG